MSEQSLLQQAIAAARAGRKAEARQLLEQVLQANPRHEQAWLWMGAVVETDRERVKCLQQVLAINPDNAAARKGLAQFQARTGATPVTPQPAASPPMASCPHCGAMNRAGARFCSGCGQDLVVAVPPLPTPSPPPRQARPLPEARPKPKPAQSRRGLWIAGVAVLGLFALGVCGVGGWLLYQRMATTVGEPTAVAVSPPTITGDLTPTAVNLDTPTVESTPQPTPTEGGSASESYILFAAYDVAPTGEYSWDIYVRDVEGETRTLLAHYTSGYSLWPVGGFSPNGQWLFFITQDGTQRTFYIADVNGSNLQPIVSSNCLDIYSMEEVIFSSEGSTAWFDSFVYNWRTGQVFHLNSRESCNYDWHTNQVMDLTDYTTSVRDISYDIQWLLLTDRQSRTDAMKHYSLLNTETGQLRELGEFRKDHVVLASDGSRVFAAGCPGEVDMSCHRGSTYDLTQDQWHELPLEWPGFEIEIYPNRPSPLQIEFLPDNQHILLVTRNREKKETEIFRFNVETGELTPYFSDNLVGYFAIDTGVPWLVVGGWLPRVRSKVVLNMSYSRSENRLSKTYLANGNGSDLELLTEVASGIMFDEEHVLFEFENNVSVIQNLRSGIQQELPGQGNDLSLDLSLDESQFLIWEWIDGERMNLWLFDIPTMQLHRLGSEVSVFTIGTFSSDGHKIVYSESPGNIDFDKFEPNLYIADTDGHNVQLIEENAVPLVMEFE